ncbi:MAG: precorrin-8X methylmutase [Thermodesulfobacteriota bacterium]
MKSDFEEAVPADHAVLLLGHGSKRDDANEILREMARALHDLKSFGVVEPAFLQLAEPDFHKALEGLLLRGFRDITVMPYFLYCGDHVVKDIPGEMDMAREKYPDLKMRITKNLGVHGKLVDIVVERLTEAMAPESSPGIVHGQHPIEKESFGIIESETDLAEFSPVAREVVKRVIHATADFEFKDILCFSDGAVEAGLEAIAGGADIITDVKMVESGISRGRLAPFGATVRCFSSDPAVAREAKSTGATRTATAMAAAAPFMDGAIVAIGNAPTALTELLSLVKAGKASPALIIGVPVGFVGAEAAKDALIASDQNYIAAKGRKGGSSVAVSIVNALIIEAARGLAPAL